MLRQFSVINVNDAPIISSSSIAFIQENNSLDDIVYRIIADDIDSNQLIYNIDGYDSDYFTINNSNGELKLKNSSDFETKEIYNFNVIVSDGEFTDTKNVNLYISDINELPISLVKQLITQ